MTDPSDEFIEIFRDDGAGSIRTCDRCGMTAFNSDGDWDWDDGELEDFQRLATEKPEKYIDVDYSVGGYVVLGMFLMDNCDCGHLVEKMLLRDRDRLASYLRKRMQRAVDEAQKTLDSLGTPDHRGHEHAND